MSAAVYDIFWLRLPYGLSRDIRPCVVIRIEPDGMATVLRISSAMELYDPYKHFKISPARAEFASTGLGKESFCDDSKFFKVPVSTLLMRIGAIDGKLRRDFDKWLGLA